MRDRRVIWAVPLERAVADKAVISLMNVAQRAGQLGYDRVICPYGRTDAMRNYIATKFQEMTADDPNPDDTLVMLDNDHDHPHDVIERLVENDVQIVGALAFRRGEPYDPCFFIRSEDGAAYHAAAEYEKGLYKCDAVGHAAIAIKRSAMDRMAESFPFWRYEYQDGTLHMPSEDMYFCKLAQRHNIPIYCDTRIVCPHLTHRWISEDTWGEWRAAHPELVAPV